MVTDYRDLLDRLLFQIVIMERTSYRFIKRYQKLKEWAENDERSYHESED